MKKMKQTIKMLTQYIKIAGYIRWSRMLVAVVFVLSLFIPTFIQISEIRAYQLSPEVKKVLGSANKNLSAKFSIDKDRDIWQFNKNGVASLASNIAKREGKQNAEDIAGGLSQLAAQQAGGSGKSDTSLYSVDLPVKAEEGITYYDNVTRLSFKMIPTFNARDAKLIDDRIVYPFGGGGKIVYTAKSNGLKEDIVLSDYIGDTLRYGYTLDLPDTLEARILDDGSIGIYSANPALFGNISFNSDEDRARVAEGRKNGHKDNLVFGIPAPFIKDQKGEAGKTHYELEGKKLTVVASGLKDLSYPLAVDPSVTVTSSADFEAGNLEDAIEIGSSGQIDRTRVTGATIGAFTAASTMNTQRALMDSAVYNGYIYAVGSWSAQTTGIEYAKIQSNGSLGAWTQQATGLSNRYGFGVATYNGYLYLTGGMESTPLNTTSYAKLNADGSVGTMMTASNNFNTGRYFHKTKIYNGYIYVIGGRGDASGFDIDSYSSTRYAKLKANGDIDTWISASTLPTPRLHFGMAIYNDRMYVVGGFYYDNTPVGAATKAYVDNIISADINSDGSLGAWSTNVASIAGLEGGRAEIYAGYMYVLRSSDISYAPISLNGKVGTFATTTAPPDFGSNAAMAIYNGYLYKYGGGTGGSDLNTAYYTPISAAGSLRPYAATTDFDTGSGNERSSMATVATNGYLYILGGELATGGQTNTVRSAPINANGTIGSWSANTSFTDARLKASAVAYGNSIYLVGGQRTGAGTVGCTQAQTSYYCQEVIRATVNPSNGVLTWSGSYTYSSQGRATAGTVVNNGYLYVIGGRYSNNSQESAEVNFAQIGADGTLGTFSTTQPMIASRSLNVGAVAWDGRIYVIGGWTNATSEYAVPNADGTIPASGAGTWTYTGGSLPTYLQYAQTVVSRGYIYVTGGSHLNFANGSDTTQITKINSDGTLGGWTTSNRLFPSIRHAHGSATYNGYLYVFGGCTNSLFCNVGNSLKDVQYARINNGDNGDVQTWNATSTSFPTARSSHGSFAYNGFLYVLGGGTNGGSVGGANTQVYAPISTSGVVGAWTTIPNPPTMYGNEAWVFKDGYVYKMGGRQSVANSYVETWYAAVCTGANTTTVFSTNCTTGSAPGTLSSWNAGASMNTGRDEFGAVAHNGYMYVFGGCTGSAPRLDWICTGESNTVEVSQINSTTGALGTWTALSSGNNFTTPRFKHQAVAYNGYVYLIGGCANIPNISSACDTDLSDVQVAKLSGAGLAANAGCGAVWCKQDALVSARMEFGATAYNGYLYVTGGAEGPFSDVQFAPIASNGSLGTWVKAHTDFTTARRGHSTVAYGGNLYVLGGSNAAGTTYYADVQFAGLDTIPRISKYSKLLTLDPTTEVAGVYYNGLLNGDSSVTYKVAPNTGIFGSSTPATSGNGSEPTPLCGLGSIYYVQFTVTLKDTTTATFPDSGAGNVTDVTTYYRLSATPPPNLRLNGGKWFYEEQPRPLDTCKI